MTCAVRGVLSRKGHGHNKDGTTLRVGGRKQKILKVMLKWLESSTGLFQIERRGERMVGCMNSNKCGWQWYIYNILRIVECAENAKQMRMCPRLKLERQNWAKPDGDVLYVVHIGGILSSKVIGTTRPF